MSILLLSRPVSNAGDFLFTKKSLDAFLNICPEVDVQKGHISNTFDVNYLNSFEAIVAAGGPLYDDAFLTDDKFPVLSQLEEIVPKIYFLSCGCYGTSTSVKEVFDRKFNTEVRQKLIDIQNKNGVYSTRDIYSEIILKNNGIKNVNMIGCTAWYDYNNIDVLVPHYSGEIKKIVISDQGVTKDSRNWDWKFQAFKDTVDCLIKKFKESHFLFTFNGGIQTKYSGTYNERVCDYLKQHGIEYKDISGSSEGFSLCDDCDLHVGFRVHTHIYCLSKRIPSVLIGEDLRGSSLNQTLGTPDILDFSYEDGSLKNNEYLGLQIGYYIDDILQMECDNFVPVYEKMNLTYHKAFVPFVRRICNL